MATTTLKQVAESTPDRRVRLFFQNEKGTGSMVMTAKKAVLPNASGRYFPPVDQTAQDMKWPVPYWYGAEVKRFEFA